MNLENVKALGLVDLRDLYTEDLLTRSGVVGVGIGTKKTKGIDTNKLAIIVYVKKKLKLVDLNDRDKIPNILNSRWVAFPTDVVQVGEFRALSRTDRVRPCPGGMSIGHHKITAGTFGFVVKDTDSGTKLILSNNHVLANSNDAMVGDAILQPGPYDGGILSDKIAGLLRFIPIQFAEDTCPMTNIYIWLGNLFARLSRSKSRLYAKRQIENYVDCAVAVPDPDDVLPTILEIGEVAGINEDVSVGTKLKKSGRTTELTFGHVQSIGTTVMVNYGGKNALFVDQIISDVGSDGGDSGSAILDDDNKFVALLFAGGEGTTIGNRARLVMDSLNISIL